MTKVPIEEYYESSEEPEQFEKKPKRKPVPNEKRDRIKKRNKPKRIPKRIIK